MTSFLLLGLEAKTKAGRRICFDTPLCFFLYASKFAHEKAGTGCRSKLHMHIIMVERLVRFMGRIPLSLQTGQAKGLLWV